MKKQSWLKGRRLSVVAALAAVGVIAAGSAAYALNAESDGGGVPLSGVSAPAGPGQTADIPPSAVSLVDVASLQFLGTGPGGFRIWRGDGAANGAKGLVCFVTAGTSEGLPMSGTDCDTAKSFVDRGVTLAGTTGPEGHFVGYAVLADGLTDASVDGRSLPVANGIVFLDVRPGAKQLTATGASRTVSVDLTSAAKPIS